MSELRNYDSWLEAPYQRRHAEPPRDVEDLLGVKIWIEEEDAWGEVTSWEEWTDADEDGRYGGVDLIVTVRGRDQNMRPDDVEELLLITTDDRRTRA